MFLVGFDGIRASQLLFRVFEEAVDLDHRHIKPTQNQQSTNHSSSELDSHLSFTRLCSNELANIHENFVKSSSEENTPPSSSLCWSTATNLLVISSSGVPLFRPASASRRPIETCAKGFKAGSCGCRSCCNLAASHCSATVIGRHTSESGGAPTQMPLEVDVEVEPKVARHCFRASSVS
mgnify:CR=1 FL=1